MRVLIADGHPMIHAGLGQILKSLYPEVEIIKTFDGTQMIEKLKFTDVDLVFMDINMPGISAFNSFEQLMHLYPHLRVIIYSQNSASIYGNRYMALGAAAFVEKNVSEEHLKEVIQAVVVSEICSLETCNVFHPSDSKEEFKYSLLSNRELEVAMLLVKGFENSDICARLQISASTVSTYRARVFEKLGATRTSEFFELAKAYNLV